MADMDIFKDVRNSSASDIRHYIETDFDGDANYQNNSGETLLHFAACTAGNVEVVKVLVSMGANVNASTNGITPLHVAQDAQIAQVLISLGADVNAKADNGLTPLDIAKETGNTAMVQYFSGIIAGKEKAVEKAAIDQILANYKDELTNNPNDAKVYEERGCEFLSKGYLDQGIADFTQIIKLNPNNAEAYRFRGMAYSQQKKYDKAIADFNEAIRLKPNEFVDYMSRGVAYYEIHLKDQARRDLEKVLTLNPDNTTLSVAKDLLEAMNQDEQERIDRERREEQERIEKQRQEEEDARKAEIKKKQKKIAIAVVIAAICIVAGLIVFNKPKKSVTIPGSPVSTNQQSSPASSDNSQQSQNSFQATHKVVTNDGSNLRLRDAAGFSGSQIGSLEYGSSVRVLEIGESAVDSDGNRGNWTYVSTPDGKKGWCFGAYLQVLPQ
jgi:tetratricopeptide (TPR) repeat protein